MRKFIIQVILLIAVIGAAIFLLQNNQIVSNLPLLPQQPKEGKVEINNAVMSVEIADTPEKRSKGLGGRESLASDAGMLFIFPKLDKYPFWMKELNFPLDFVWIRGDKVIETMQNIQPPLPGQSNESLPIFSTKEDVDKVLEVNAGTVNKLNIKAGDTIKIQ